MSRSPTDRIPDLAGPERPSAAHRAFTLGLLALSLMLSQTLATGADLADTVASVKRSVVAVGLRPSKGTSAPVLRGNGFVVAGGNHVVTAARVVPGGSRTGDNGGLAVFVPAGGRHAEGWPAREVMCDTEHDLCLLRFDGPALPALRMGRSADVREGEVHAYTGFPTAGAIGLHAVTHRGIVSAVSPNVVPPVSAKLVDRDILEKLARPYPVFQLDVSAFPGNEGSPLYEPATGRVVGIINSPFVKATKELSMPGASAISYAIPVDHIRALLDRAGLGY
jgi:S1-C subfamily serine protease